MLKVFVDNPSLKVVAADIAGDIIWNVRNYLLNSFEKTN